jgi:hypothetical protein
MPIDPSPRESTPRDPHDLELGLAILVEESASGEYEPIAVIGSIHVGVILARADLAERLALLARGAKPLLPEEYMVWSQGFGGKYRRYETITRGDGPVSGER